ncbi:hypothetical protein OG292_19895 [Streptomyces sp. NBC_01511]|uniref:hypothetical protein n=1 Tax=Streptomyces sp. NBC_01511 TaxID=2903889 RepID=UPI0038660206
MARVYATSAEYETYTGQTAPADIGALLARASRFLDSRVIRLCWYDADDVIGMPTDEVVLEAFSAAVCAQVQWWEETGDELGVAQRYGTVKLGSASLSGPGSSSGSSGPVGGREVADAAMEALRSPDLTPCRFVLGLVCS